MSDTNAAAEYWENRYREKGRSWSGHVNAALAGEVGGIRPGTALDLGSGEGGDALWLASEGWSVTAVDIAPTALAIGAAAQHPDDDITWIAADLATWQPPTTYDLVTSCFLHSTVELPREAILRRAAAAVAPGGILLIVGHSGAPHWPASDVGKGAGHAGHAASAGHAAHAGAHEEDASPDADADAMPELPTPQEVLADLFDGDPRLTHPRPTRSDWTVLTEALIDRDFTAPDGTTATITDGVLKLRRADRPS